MNNIDSNKRNVRKAEYKNETPTLFMRKTSFNLQPPPLTQICNKSKEQETNKPPASFDPPWTKAQA